jgi:hypothetical protein
MLAGSQANGNARAAKAHNWSWLYGREVFEAIFELFAFGILNSIVGSFQVHRESLPILEDSACLTDGLFNEVDCRRGVIVA